MHNRVGGDGGEILSADKVAKICAYGTTTRNHWTRSIARKGQPRLSILGAFATGLRTCLFSACMKTFAVDLALGSRPHRRAFLPLRHVAISLRLHREDHGRCLVINIRDHRIR